MSAYTVDDFYSGRLKVYQPEQGFRAGTDSLLLASALNRFTEGDVLERLGLDAGVDLRPRGELFEAWQAYHEGTKALKASPEGSFGVRGGPEASTTVSIPANSSCS